jgi:uncharacterized damage-inducible protein DinB
MARFAAREAGENPRMTDLAYPIGRLSYDSGSTPDKRRNWIRQIADAPAALRAAVKGLDATQLETPYRPDGWTVRQVVHHVPESHMNAYIRFKLALTEDNPTIKPYDEAAWSRTADTIRTPIDVSLSILDALHARWVVLLESLAPEDFARRFVHPESGPMTVDRLLQLYAWHGQHHTAQITGLRARRGW